MRDDQFEQDFTWYEWGFVNPGDVPNDDLRVPFQQDTYGYEPEAWMQDAWREERQWMT